MGAEDPVLCFSIETFIWVQRIRESSVPKWVGAEDPVSFGPGAEDPVLSFSIVTSILGTEDPSYQPNQNLWLSLLQ